MQTTEQLVRRFWELMATNEFSSVAEVLAPEFVLEWPQSGERLRGAERFAQMNTDGAFWYLCRALGPDFLDPVQSL